MSTGYLILSIRAERISRLLYHDSILGSHLKWLNIELVFHLLFEISIRAALRFSHIDIEA